MRRDKWDYLLDLLVRQMGEAAGKERFLEVWGEAGARRVEEREKDEIDRQLQHDILEVLDGVK